MKLLFVFLLISSSKLSASEQFVSEHADLKFEGEFSQEMSLDGFSIFKYGIPSLITERVGVSYESKRTVFLWKHEKSMLIIDGSDSPSASETVKYLKNKCTISKENELLRNFDLNKPIYIGCNKSDNVFYFAGHSRIGKRKVESVFMQNESTGKTLNLVYTYESSSIRWYAKSIQVQ